MKLLLLLVAVVVLSGCIGIDEPIGKAGSGTANNSTIQINESQVNNLTADLNAKVNKSGDTMTGELKNASFDERFILDDNSKILGGMMVWDCIACSGGSYNFYSVNVLWNSTSAAMETGSYDDRYGVELMSLGNRDDAFFRWFVFPPNISRASWREFMRWQNSTNMFTFYAPTNVTVSALAGTGNAYACIDSTGKLYRSATACA